jgi:hypothetical protein
MFSFTNNKKFAPETIREQLSVVPVLNEHVRTVEESDDCLVIEVERRGIAGSKVASDFLKLRKDKQYELEGPGLKLYRAIDGRTTVADLMQNIRDEHLLSFHEARALTVNLLYALVQHGLAVIVKADD